MAGAGAAGSERPPCSMHPSVRCTIVHASHTPQHAHDSSSTKLASGRRRTCLAPIRASLPWRVMCPAPCLLRSTQACPCCVCSL
eukprot:363009-Chlamydomonas_euryale.AAC.1